MTTKVWNKENDSDHLKRQEIYKEKLSLRVSLGQPVEMAFIADVVDDLRKNAQGIGNFGFFQRRKLAGYETVVWGKFFIESFVYLKI